MEVGRRIYESDYRQGAAGTTPIAPTYGYNQKLDTCVMYVGYLGNNYQSHMIIDSLSNRELASHIRRGDEVLGLQFGEFEQKRRELFEEQQRR